MLRALDLYASTKLDFGDALLVASLEQAGSSILYSYDTDFDRIPTVTPRSPGAVPSPRSGPALLAE